MEHIAEPNFIGTLGLNVKLFLAQLLNFAIVLFILWKWVFKPVGGALERRRQRIEQSVKTAEEIEERMKIFEREQQQKMAVARAEAESIIQRAAAAAAAENESARAQARSEAEKILADARAAIQADKERVVQAARSELAELTALAAEKILRAKLDHTKDRRLIEEVLKQTK